MEQALLDIQAQLPGDLLALNTFGQDTCDLVADLGSGAVAVRLQRGDSRSRFRLEDGLVLVPLGDAGGCAALHKTLAADRSLPRRIMAAAQHGHPPEYDPQLKAPFENPGKLSTLIRATLSGDPDAAAEAADLFVDAAGGRSWERRVAVDLLLLAGAHHDALRLGSRLIPITFGQDRATLGAQLASALRAIGEDDDAASMEGQTSSEPPSAELVEWWRDVRERAQRFSAAEVALALSDETPTAESTDAVYDARRALADGDVRRAAWTLVRQWRERADAAWQAAMGECLIAVGRSRRGIAYVEDALASEPEWVGLHVVAARGLAAIDHLEAARAQLEYAARRAPGVFEGLGRELPTDDSALLAFADGLLKDAFLNRCSSLVSYRSGDDVVITTPVTTVRTVLERAARHAEIFGDPADY